MMDCFGHLATRLTCCKELFHLRCRPRVEKRVRFLLVLQQMPKHGKQCDLLEPGLLFFTNQAPMSSKDERSCSVSIGGKLPKNAGIKIPTWRTWGILKQQGKSVPSCFKEAIHVSHRGTVHDQRYVSQRGFH